MSIIETREQTVQTPDGALRAHVALPASGSGPGMLVIHEIFGVNDYVRDSARRLAEAGYVALAPDMFWRTRPGLELPNDEESMPIGREAVGELDTGLVVADAIAALGALRELPECDGRAGVMGFCFGATIGWRVAAADEPDVAVLYYGSGITGAPELADRITCPTIMHWGGADEFIPREAIDSAVALAAAHENIEAHVHEGAGHAFDNHRSERFWVPAASAAAWEQTAEFLDRELPAG